VDYVTLMLARVAKPHEKKLRARSAYTLSNDMPASSRNQKMGVRHLFLI
jgi:hypothetical protein